MPCDEHCDLAGIQAWVDPTDRERLSRLRHRTEVERDQMRSQRDRLAVMLGSFARVLDDDLGIDCDELKCQRSCDYCAPRHRMIVGALALLAEMKTLA